MRFQLLGPVEACLDGGRVDLGPRRQRCVLAALLADAGRVVPVDQLADRVWGERPPPSARATLHSYISRLRKAGVYVAQRSGGYSADGEVDLHRFRRLVRGARAADDSRALTLFEEALGLWHGEPFAGLRTPWFDAERTALERERAAAVRDHADIALRLGLHATLMPELSTLAGENPLDERVAGQLMLALYRNGRQAEALERYQRTRLLLSEELGTDPSPPLRELHQRILTSDPALACARPRSAVPRQLPAAPLSFVGRERELEQVSSALDDLRACVISGAGGVGKTWLALHWAHHNIDRFPDGQLYVDLHGFDPAGEPVPPAVAVRGFLEALGVAAAAIPASADERSALLRSVTAGKRLLIVLDNARDSRQVVSLLPGDAGAAVLVTSRATPTGLVATRGARLVAVDLLDAAQARELLERHLPQAPDSGVVDELLRYCAGLPLALAIVAARVATNRDFPLELLAAELRSHASRLDTLDTGEADLNLRAVFASSIGALSEEAATLFRLLGHAPGPDIGIEAAAALGAVTALCELVSGHLVRQHVPGRYRMHDLVRLYAKEGAVDDTALRRLTDHYLLRAYAGERLLEPHRPSIDLSVAAVFTDEASAMAWFEAEHNCLLAAQQFAFEQGWHTAVWQLAWSTDTFQYRRGHMPDQLRAWQRGLASAEQLGDLATQSLAHRLLGHALAQLTRHGEALDHLNHAMALAKDTGDLADQAHTHQSLTWLWGQRGDDQAALDHAAQALHLYRTIDNPVGTARALNLAGLHSMRLGRHDEGRTYLVEALGLYRVHGYRAGEAASLTALGYLAHLTGDFIEAAARYREAIPLCRAVGNAYLEAEVFERLGNAHHALGSPREARAAWRQSVSLYRAQHRTAEGERVEQLIAE